MENDIKMNFFQKIKIAIFNLEKYGLFITENLGKSIKYMFLLILIFTICYAGIYTYDISKMIDKGMYYIENELPEFTLSEEGNIKFESSVNGYDKDYNFKIENIEKDELENKDLNKYYDYSSTLLLLNDKIIFISNGQKIEYSYNYIQESFGLKIENKTDLMENFNNLGGKGQLTSILAITLFISFLTANIYQIILDCLIVAIYGYFVARINRIKIKFGTVTTLAIYSLTLSTILNGIYVIAYYFTKFEIEYFSWLYIIIAYIYITAAILMIKTDLIKQVMELRKIEEEQKNIINENKEENLDRKKEKEEETIEDKTEDNNGIDTDKEPDGSEI